LIFTKILPIIYTSKKYGVTMTNDELKTIRKDLGYSQEKMASYLKMCYSGYTKQETGKIPVSRKTVLELSIRDHVILDKNYEPLKG
jgi:transcriptional regulator with XRE-family HTH domain